MPHSHAPSSHDAARRVLCTTATAWRLNVPARHSARGVARRFARGAAASANEVPCQAWRWKFLYSGHGLAISY